MAALRLPANRIRPRGLRLKSWSDLVWWSRAQFCGEAQSGARRPIRTPGRTAEIFPMGWLKKKSKPLTDRQQALNKQIASLEAEIKRLDAKVNRGPAQPRMRSTA